MNNKKLYKNEREKLFLHYFIPKRNNKKINFFKERTILSFIKFRNIIININEILTIVE